MSNTRIAVLDDAAELATMLGEFYNESCFAGKIPFCPDDISASLHAMLDHGMVFVLENEDESLAGAIGFHITNSPMNKDFLIAQEAFWYIRPEHRGSQLAGIKLFKKAESWLLAHGEVDAITMSALSSSPEILHSLYQKLGYNPEEVAYIKWLGVP